MDILYLMILCSVSLGAVFLVVFIINVKKGQFEDDESPAVRILLDHDRASGSQAKPAETELPKDNSK